MSEQFFVSTLSNGLTLLAQPMEGVSSAAVSLSMPAGSARDPQGAEGSAAVAAEWIARGAGDYDARGLNDALDGLGIDHHESGAGRYLQLNQSLLGRNLNASLNILADMARRPRLDAKTFEPCQMLIRQDLASLDDEPARKAMAMLREKALPAPLGRMAYGSDDSLQALTADALREHITSAITPNGAVLSVAGDVDIDALQRDVETFFGDWTGSPAGELALTPPIGGEHHIAKETAQAHITLACPSVVMSDPRYFAARMVESVLCRGMGSRLFTEVREKRGLCYRISCQYAALKEQANLLCYAGTRPDLAEKTLEVICAELARLSEGVEAEELDRAKTQLRCNLIMQGQSSVARAGALVSDWHHLGRLRSLDEISQAIQAVTLDEVMDYIRTVPPTPETQLVIAPEAI